MTNLFGMEIVVSEFAKTTVPVRKHKKRRNQSKAYHLRVQKKWLKRWGTKTVPSAYVFNRSALGFGQQGEVMVVHPSLAVLMKGYT